MSKYSDYKKQVEKMINNFPIGFAFSQKQFEEAKQKLNVKPGEKLIKIGGGGFIKKSDLAAYDKMFDDIDSMFKRLIEEDTTGTGFIYDMFSYELSNHEYCITYEIDDTLNALDLTIEEINSNPSLLKGLKKAIKDQEKYM